MVLDCLLSYVNRTRQVEGAARNVLAAIVKLYWSA